MKKQTVTATMLREMFIEEVSKSKGVFIFRRGYFYRSGTPDKYAEMIKNKLTQQGFQFTILESGDNWKPFKGGGTTAQNSHFYVKVNITGYTPVQNE